jgi:hypothetical protein
VANAAAKLFHKAFGNDLAYYFLSRMAPKLILVIPLSLVSALTPWPQPLLRIPYESIASPTSSASRIGGIDPRGNRRKLRPSLVARIFRDLFTFPGSGLVNMAPTPSCQPT